MFAELYILISYNIYLQVRALVVSTVWVEVHSEPGDPRRINLHAYDILTGYNTFTGCGFQKIISKF